MERKKSKTNWQIRSGNRHSVHQKKKKKLCTLSTIAVSRSHSVICIHLLLPNPSKFYWTGCAGDRRRREVERQILGGKFRLICGYIWRRYGGRGRRPVESSDGRWPLAAARRGLEQRISGGPNSMATASCEHKKQPSVSFVLADLGAYPSFFRAEFLWSLISI